MLRPVGGHLSAYGLADSISFNPVLLLFWSADRPSIEPEDEFVLVDNFSADWLDFGGIDVTAGSGVTVVVVSACLFGFGNCGIKNGSFGVCLLLLLMLILLLLWFDEDEDEAGTEDEDFVAVCDAFVMVVVLV